MADVATLPWTDALASLLSSPSKEIESAIDDMTVEPSDWNGEATENNLVGKELPGVVNIESVESCLVEFRHTFRKHVGHRIALGHIHPRSKRNADGCCQEAEPSYT